MRNAAVDRMGTVKIQAPRAPARAACVVSSGRSFNVPGCTRCRTVTPSEHAAAETAIREASSRRNVM